MIKKFRSKCQTEATYGPHRTKGEQRLKEEKSDKKFMKLTTAQYQNNNKMLFRTCAMRKITIR